jgi:hypothetical protein
LDHALDGLKNHWSHERFPTEQRQAQPARILRKCKIQCIAHDLRTHWSGELLTRVAISTTQVAGVIDDETQFHDGWRLLSVVAGTAGRLRHRLAGIGLVNVAAVSACVNRLDVRWLAAAAARANAGIVTEVRTCPATGSGQTHADQGH